MASYLIVRHKVRDFAFGKAAYDAGLPKREEAGLTEKYLLRGADDPNEVGVVSRLPRCSIQPGLRVALMLAARSLLMSQFGCAGVELSGESGRGVHK